MNRTINEARFFEVSMDVNTYDMMDNSKNMKTGARERVIIE